MNDESKEYRRENIREDIKESKDGNDRKLEKIEVADVIVQDGVEERVNEKQNGKTEVIIKVKENE